MLTHVLNGFAYGGLLFLVTVGLVFLFGLRRIVNFAHGGLFMIGAYVGYSVTQAAGFWAGVVCSTLVLAAVGILLDRIVFRPLAEEDPIATVLVTFGLLIVLEDVARTVWGKGMLALEPPAGLAGVMSIADSAYPTYRLALVALALAVAGTLSLWLRFSRTGLYVRALSADPLTTGMQGVNTERLSATVVAIGTGLAGLSGTVAAPLLTISPNMGSSILVQSFIVVVVGGLSSFSGAFIAAMVVGQLHNFGLVYVPWAASMLPFLLMIIVLIARPNTLSGAS